MKSIIVIGIMAAAALIAWKNNERSSFENSSKSNVIDTGDDVLVFTESELKEINNWDPGKNKACDIIEAAENNDRGALYSYGLAYLSEDDGSPADWDKASIFLSDSTSLGLVPAMHLLRTKYIHLEQNIFLGTIYLHLIIACGHKESVETFHHNMDILDSIYGVKISNILKEIERLSFRKLERIKNNIKNFEVADDKKDFSLINIAAEDKAYNLEYWTNIANQVEKTSWFERIEELEIGEQEKEYLKFVTEAFYDIPAMVDYEINDFDIRNFLENNIPELTMTQEGQEKVRRIHEEFQIIPAMKSAAMEKIMNSGIQTVFDFNEAVRIACEPRIRPIITKFKVSIKYSN